MRGVERELVHEEQMSNDKPSCTTKSLPALKECAKPGACHCERRSDEATEAAADSLTSSWIATAHVALLAMTSETESLHS